MFSPNRGATTKAKIAPYLDEQAIDFLQTCPFGLMATAGRDGPIEVSPKGDEPGFVRVENETNGSAPGTGGQQPRVRPAEHHRDRPDRDDFPAPGPARRCGSRAGRRSLTMPNCWRHSASEGRPALLAIRIHIEGAAISTARARCCARSSGNPSIGRNPSASRSERSSRPRTGADEDQAAKIDAFVEQGYTTNLWSNG